MCDFWKGIKRISYGEEIESAEKILRGLWGMNMADVIKSIEHEAFREVQAHEITGRNGEHIDCSTLEDEPVIVADNEADRQALRGCFKER